MRSPDSQYDPRKWHAEIMKRRPRRRETRWVMLLGLMFVVLGPAIDLAKPGGASLTPSFMLLIVGSSMSPFTRQAFLVDKGFASFDEFERQALLMALRRAYLMMLALIVALFAWLSAGQRLGWPIPATAHQWFTLGGALVIVLAALPALIAEWTVPFPDAEDYPL